MFNIVNHAIPIFGLVLCIIVTLIKKINTRGAICTAKLHLYAVGWLVLVWADWGSDYAPTFAITLFSLIMLINNLLYVKQLTIPRPIKFKTLWPPKFKH